MCATLSGFSFILVNGYWVLSNAFSESWYSNMIFLLFVNDRLVWFFFLYMLNQFWILRMCLTWSWLIIILIHCWIVFWNVIRYLFNLTDKCLFRWFCFSLCAFWQKCIFKEIDLVECVLVIGALDEAEGRRLLWHQCQPVLQWNPSLKDKQRNVNCRDLAYLVECFHSTTPTKCGVCL